MTVLLDTNVVSELMKPAPAPAVIAWMTRIPSEDAALAAPTVAEILYGLRRMPEGAKRSQKASAFAAFAETLTVLPFDSGAAALYAEIVARREAAGSPISVFDAQIAAIARSHSAEVATRDFGGFEQCGVTIVDPWREGAAP